MFGRNELIVCIKGGAVEFGSYASEKLELKKFAQTFKYDELEKYMAGYYRVKYKFLPVIKTDFIAEE